MTRVLGQSGATGVQLLCMDALSLTAGNDSDLGQRPDGWSANAIRLLAHARSQSWSVGHVISRRPRPGEVPWRPVQGLTPRPSEPVYHRNQPSAFSSEALCAALDRARLSDIVLCGVSVDGSFLRTALDAVRRRRRLTIAADAIGIASSEREGLEGLLGLQRLGLTGGVVRMVSIDILVRPWRQLRVVQGGRV